jgi:hypothetical protein
VFREIPADLQASTTFAVIAKDERNGSRHGKTLGTEFDERLDIILRNVQMNVITAILGASSVSGEFSHDPIREWHFKRSGKRDEIHLALERSIAITKCYFLTNRETRRR